MPLSHAVKVVLAGCPNDQFFFLTKAPEKIAAWGKWADNAWIGASAWNQNSIENTLGHLSLVEAKHKWLSIEPLVGNPAAYTWQGVLKQHGIGFVVVGARDHGEPPKREWVESIVQSAKQAGIPIWLKNNLHCIGGQIQELPKLAPRNAAYTWKMERLLK